MGAEAGVYDVIVVGAGHAGCEAALAAARLGCSVLMLTLNLENVALMPCNPSVGGPAKGHLVREIDALGGQMALATDAAAVQFRELNTGKGAAVRAYRAQVDRRAYQRVMRAAVSRQPGLTVRQALVDELVVEGGRVAGVRTRTGLVFPARAVVLATGVYLAARVITGESVLESGPYGQVAAGALAAWLRRFGFAMVRFKTGTPPRVWRRSVDVSVMERQEGSQRPLAFSFLTDPGVREQLPCWLTHTNERTHEIIRRNLHRAPLFTGVIEGRGPRYCPSIEDKVVRFADKAAHQVFVEPEGWDEEELYLQGLSTSLPEEVQIEMVRSIRGLERAEIARPGYAIEYDAIVPTQLKRSLEARALPGLFCAGQINGTSGYEEAAAQGLMAGINAARSVRGEEPVVLGRDEAYIGVLIDDLVTKGADEPYRMLTARAEFRLLLQQNNADMRLTEKGRAIGLVGDERYRRYVEKRRAVEEELERLRAWQVRPGGPEEAVLRRHGLGPLEGAVAVADLLRRPGIGYELVEALGGWGAVPGYEVREQVETALKYEGYLERERAEVERLRRLEGKRIPDGFDYGAVAGLSTEARERLAAVRPESLGQAMRLPGVNPADAVALLVALERRRGPARERGEAAGHGGR